MKIRIRPEHTRVLQEDDWLAELREGESADPDGLTSAESADTGHAEPADTGHAEPADTGHAEPADTGHAVPASPGHAVPASPGHAVPASPGRAEPTSYVRAMPAGPGYAVPAGHGRAEPVDGGARPEALAGPVHPAASAATAAPAGIATLAVPATPAAPPPPTDPAAATERAVIGDGLRRPIMWCEMGSCISWHADPAALGEADSRARAIKAGWRIDAFGRLVCPPCQQADPHFRSSSQVVPWDRYRAVAAAARAAAMPGDQAARDAALWTGHDPGRIARGYPPASRTELERHHDFPAAQAMFAGQRAERPANAAIAAVRG
jgi:hypothetical protein